MKKLLSILAVGALVAVFAVATQAAAVGTNGSFESGINPGAFTMLSSGDNTSINDWTVSSGSVDYIGSYWQAADGDNSLDLNGNAAGSVSQTFDTVAGASYAVSFSLSGNPDAGPTAKVVRVSASGGSPASQDFTFDTAAKGNTKEDMKWESDTFTFTASGTSTTLTFASQVEGAFGPALDKVSIEETLPAATHTITASAGANGSIAPSGAVVVDDGDDQTFAITPNSGYKIDEVLVDGSDVGEVSSYTFNDVNANHTISASFELKGEGRDNDKDACKDGGWKNFSNPSFKNQGQCVSAMNHHDNDKDEDDNDNEIESHDDAKINSNSFNVNAHARFSFRDDEKDED